MIDEKENYLFNTFPNLFPGGKNADMQVSLMRFGFPGDGWFELIKDLCEKITEMKVGVTVVQVKEKFGGLRFYIDFNEGTSKEDIHKVYELISQAEDKAYTICEQCGKPGIIREDRHWILTLCDECNKPKDA